MTRAAGRNITRAGGSMTAESRLVGIVSDALGLPEASAAKVMERLETFARLVLEDSAEQKALLARQENQEIHAVKDEVRRETGKEITAAAALAILLERRQAAQAKP
jgi:hypothetical protein